jgi:hypothetical protein
VSYLHVATNGNDANAGDESAPFRTPQRAVKLVRPGDEVLLHAGTYSGAVTFDRGGTQTAPCKLRGGIDGPVTLTASLPAVAVSSQTPMHPRTLLFKAGGWNLADLNIVGGINLLAPGIGNVPAWAINTHNAPGCGALADPGAHAGLFAWLRNQGVDVTPIDHFRLDRVKVTKRGLYPAGARYMEIDACEISDIEGGTGGGLWAGRGASFGKITNSRIHGLAASYDPKTNAQHHFMSECIRLATLSSYWLVENNRTEDAAGFGRGCNCDVNSNHHVFRGNTARRCHRGMSNQAECWGVQWIENLMEDNREFGFTAGPGTRAMLMRCNSSLRAVKRDIFTVYAEQSRWEANNFPRVAFNSTFAPKFGALGNRWDGRTTVPTGTYTMDVSAFGACGTVGANLT